MDFFTVPTITFRVLYWFVVEHDRRRILRSDVTKHPAATWVIQQLREAFPFGAAARHLIFDRDSIFSAEVVGTVKSFGMKPTRTAWRSPWQNGVAERWIGSVRRELLDHVVVLGERHLRRLLRDYVAYYHDDRTHLGLGKATPAERPVEPRPAGGHACVVMQPRGRRAASPVRVALCRVTVSARSPTTREAANPTRCPIAVSYASAARLLHRA